VSSFDLTDSGGIALALVRGLADAAVLLVFGTMVLRAVVAPMALALVPPQDANGARMGLTRLGLALSVAAMLILGVWLVLVARSLADATDAAATAAAVWTVITDTTFGHVVLGELCGLVLVAGFLGARRPWTAAAAVPAGATVVFHAWHGHSYGMGNPLLILSASLHLLAAGAWLGSLPAFALMARWLPLPAVAMLARRFSPLGLVCVLTLAVTAFFQGWILIGSVGALTATAYGWMALLKLSLFGVLVGLAAFNRLWVMPRLRRTDSASGARSVLIRSVGLEMMVGVAVVLAAGLLGSLPPGMRM
jgi:putative copper resistance protein D